MNERIGNMQKEQNIDVYDYNKLLSKSRLRPSTINRKALIDQFYSDRSRILFCSSFRRLMQKAQVFSLEPNSSIRTRLTHSLEVSDIGRTLANEIAYKLKNKKWLTENNMQPFVAVVENACLLHDIGNPPFGHFGEAAIQKWAKNTDISEEHGLGAALSNEVKKHVPFLKGSTSPQTDDEKLFNTLIADFKEFDGNPQGFRTVTKLHTEYDEFGLNLTYATLLSIIKYSRAAGENPGSSYTLKKAGYFQSEKSIVEKIYSDLGLELQHRTPLVYIMEAADDIAYCMSDIADGIEKRIFSEAQFYDDFMKEWYIRGHKDKELPVALKKRSDLSSFSKDFSVPWSTAARKEVVKAFFDHADEIYHGTYGELLSDKGRVGEVFDVIRAVSRKKLYNSIEAESIELTGFAVIDGILRHYEPLLRLDHERFIKLVKGEKAKDTDLERRLFNRIGHRYVDAYKFALGHLEEEQPTESRFLITEWWLRVHMLIDHISGMTDEFALETYQMLEGISVLKTR